MSSDSIQTQPVDVTTANMFNARKEKKEQKTLKKEF